MLARHSDCIDSFTRANCAHSARSARSFQTYSPISHLLIDLGLLVGTAKHLGSEEQDELEIQSMSSEALTTSEIEGEILDRASVQSSIQKQMGLETDSRRVGPGEPKDLKCKIAKRTHLNQVKSTDWLSQHERKQHVHHKSGARAMSEDE
jgi:DNA-binding LytR/AlgR family response regulator